MRVVEKEFTWANGGGMGVVGGAEVHSAEPHGIRAKQHLCRTISRFERKQKNASKQNLTTNILHSRRSDIFFSVSSNNFVLLEKKIASLSITITFISIFPYALSLVVTC